jgi:thiol:disulfide interchange protein DsbD
MRTALLITALPLAALALAPSCAGPDAEEQEQPDVSARLIADTTAVVPGKPFHLGVELTMADGWHTYWKNPGEAGLATTIDWRLPDGFQAGPLRWPVPIRFTMPGEITSFGYEGSVVLAAEVTPPDRLAQADTVHLEAHVAWLGCKEACVPGEATVRLFLPVARRAEPAQEERFDAWAARLPVDAASPQSPARMTVSGGDGFPPEGSWTVRLAWSEPVRNVDWFPAPGPALALSDVEIRTDAGKRQTEITFAARRLKGYELDREAMETVIAYTTPSEERRGVRVDIPLTAAKTATPAAP